MTESQGHRLEVAIAAVQSQISLIAGDTANCKERLIGIEGHMASVNGSVKEHGQRLTAVEKLAGDLRVAIATVSGKVNTAAARVDGALGQSWMKFLAQTVATFAAVALFLWKFGPMLVKQ